MVKGFTMDDERLKQGSGRLKMKDWIKKLDEFLTISEEKKILTKNRRNV